MKHILRPEDKSRQFQVRGFKLKNGLHMRVRVLPTARGVLIIVKPGLHASVIPLQQVPDPLPLSDIEQMKFFGLPDLIQPGFLCIGKAQRLRLLPQCLPACFITPADNVKNPGQKTPTQPQRALIEGISEKGKTGCVLIVYVFTTLLHLPVKDYVLDFIGPKTIT